MGDRTRSATFSFSDWDMPVKFGKYHLLSRLSSDPIGEEFLAAWGVEEGVDQLRVIRCVHPKLAQENEFVSLFESESRTLSRLSSSNVVRVIEFGIENGIPYVTREHVEGVNLERLIELAKERKISWPWGVAVYVVSEMLRGLDYVHRREDIHGSPMGMRHGDVRPVNVSLSMGGEVKLSNFGSTLRFIVDERTNLELNNIQGRYQPPEGVDEVTPSAHADLWAAGIVLVELLEGHLPELRGRVDGKPWYPPMLFGTVKQLPPAVDRFLRRVFSKDIESRFESAEQMRTELLKIMGKHVKGHPPDDLSAWVRELAINDERKEADLIRLMLGKEPQVDLEQSSEHSSSLLPGRVLDERYHLMRQLGEGGMGVVFEAEHLGLGRKVALKILHERVLNEPSTIERFRREAQIIGRLGHPNIVGAQDFHISGEGYHYLVMDLLEGASLAEKIDEGSVTPTELAQILVEVCEGLQAAHAAGVIHRDLKPDNVFITPYGARILDFGIAKSTGIDAEADSLTKTGHICGTVDYMSPEQMRGIKQDGRSDLFAAGVILYEGLTGELPFHGRTVGETLHKVMNDKVIPPRKRADDKSIPSALDSICVKALSKKPEDRFDSADHMARALKRYLDSVPRVTSDGAVLSSHTTGTSKRMSVLIGAAIAAVILLSVIGIWVLKEKISPTVQFSQAVLMDNAMEIASGTVINKNSETNGLPGSPLSAGATSDGFSNASVVTSLEATASDVTAPAVHNSNKADNGNVEEDNAEEEVIDLAKEPWVALDGAANKSDVAIKRANELVAKGKQNLRQTNIDAAEKYFKQAIGLYAKNSDAWYGLGKSAYQKGDYDNAKTKVTRALRYSPGNRQYRNFLGKIYLASGDKQAAISQWKKVQKGYPNDKTSQRYLEKYAAVN